jgi:hypothetical protein
VSVVVKVGKAIRGGARCERLRKRRGVFRKVMRSVRSRRREDDRVRGVRRQRGEGRMTGRVPALKRRRRELGEGVGRLMSKGVLRVVGGRSSGGSVWVRVRRIVRLKGRREGVLRGERRVGAGGEGV